MGGSIRLGQLLGLEVRLDYSWFLVFFLLTWSLSAGLFPGVYHFPPGTSWVLGISASLLLFGSVLIHEVSHCIVARRFGIEVTGITLFLCGGVAQIKGEPESPKAEFLVAVVGPVVSVALGLACLGICWLWWDGGPLGPIAALFNYLGWINLILALFNMVPGFPLDGGRIFRSIVWQCTGNVRKATRWASYTGQAFAWLLIGYGLIFEVLLMGDLRGLWMVLVGWFLNQAADSAYQQLLLKRALRGVAVADVMTHDVPTIDADMRIPEFVDDYLLRFEHPAYPVTWQGDFVGVVTVEDVRALERDLWGVTSIGALAHDPDRERVVEDSQDAWEALAQMMESDAPRLLVMHEGRVEGIVSREAIVHLVHRKMRLRSPAS
jgi:Zn-dependent protease/CBS domain-containing protein